METTVQALNGSGEAIDASKLLKTHAAPAPAKTGTSSRAKAVAAGAIGVLLLGGGAYLALTGGWVSTDDAFIEGHIVPVSAKVQGHIVKVLVEDNQAVAKGDVLAEIDAADYQTRRDDARADVAGALATVNKDELDANRYQALYERREASRQTVDHALADLQSARAALDGAQARLRQAELNASYTKILAPQAGRVTRKTVEEGAFVSVGQPLLALVPKDVWVVANFKETELRDMRPGQRAEIKVDAYPGKLSGRVESLQAGTGARFSVLPPENATGNFVKVVQRMPVKIVLDSLPDSGRLLGPGMSVEADVKVN